VLPALHLVITTHTTRHLRRTLLGVAEQSRRPDTVIVSCDNNREDVRELVRVCSAEFAAKMPDGVRLVQRPSTGACAASQVRNNGVRAALACGAGAPHSLVLLDGDCCPAQDCVARHETLLKWADLVIGFRADLSREQTEMFDEAAVTRGDPPAAVTPEQHALLVDRQRRYDRTLFLRRLQIPWLVKAHKPKVLSANFAVRLGAWLEVNGFDEQYRGYGQEDDDFSRRIYKAGFRAAIGIASAIVYHQWHETRAPGEWHDSDGAARFAGRWTARCVRGLVDPMPQETPRMEWFVGGDRREERPLD